MKEKIIDIIKNNIMDFADLIGDDLAEHIIFCITEDINDMDEFDDE